MFDFVLLACNKDFLLVLKPYCKACLRKKTTMLKVIGGVDEKEARSMVDMGVSCVSVKCECNSL